MNSKQRWVRISDKTKQAILKANHSYSCTELAKIHNIAPSSVWKIRKGNSNAGKTSPTPSQPASAADAPNN